MHPTIHAAPGSGHLSRRERQQLRRAEAFSRQAVASSPAAPPVMLDREELELIDHLVRHDRTVVSTALLVIAGIGAGEASRRAVLAAVGERLARGAAEGAISSRRADQIARHVTRARGHGDDQALAA
jgi:hypothetical protein